MSARLLPLLAALLLMACGGPSAAKRGYAAPEVDQVLGELLSRQALAHSFMAESRMEYWADSQRIKPTVYVMGERGAKVRFNALDPAGGSVAADLACNGADYQYVDFNHNCQLTGPCRKRAISQLLRVSLEPDDFLLLAVGSTPIIEAPTGALEWDSANKREILKLVSGDGQRKQEIVLDGREQRWDVLSSTVWNAEGQIEWKLTNKDFSKVESEDDKSFRLPSRTRFEQPQAKAEVSIRWKERSINPTLSQDKFVMQIPPGLPRCGQ